MGDGGLCLWEGEIDALMIGEHVRRHCCHCRSASVGERAVERTRLLGRRRQSGRGMWRIRGLGMRCTASRPSLRTGDKGVHLVVLFHGRVCVLELG